LAPLSHAVRARLLLGDAKGLGDLFAFLDTLLVLDAASASPDEVTLDEAVITCFFENIAEPDEAIKRLYTPILGPRARRYFEAWWPQSLASDFPER
jgi:hypothetical protein